MKTVKMWIVIAAMLAICAPSFGYVLVYNTLSRVKAINSTTESLVGVAVRGYLLMDINDAGEVNDSYWLVYGRDGEGTKVYTIDGLDPVMSTAGRYENIYMDTPNGWSVIVVGKITSKNIGLVDRELVAYTMSGNFIISGGVVLDASQFLTGSGAMVVTLNSTKTKTANLATDSIDDTLDNLIIAVEADGYSAG
jgi:hypothetical protein